jgi:hypothetical protein
MSTDGLFHINFIEVYIFTDSRRYRQLTYLLWL